MNSEPTPESDALTPHVRDALRHALIRRGELVPLTPQEVALHDAGAGSAAVEEAPSADQFVEQWLARRKQPPSPPSSD